MLPQPYALGLRETPAILRRIASLVDPARVHKPLSEDRFSLVEMVAHLADSEAIFLDRLRGAVERDVPTYDRFDIEARAREMGFATADLRAQLALFAERRAATVAFLEGLGSEAWAREFIAPQGRVTIERWVAFMSGHDLYHLEQAAATLSLGKG